RVAAVTGAWHSPALAGDPAVSAETDAALLAGWTTVEATSCLVPWTNAQLDSRSGYPAGIRDPLWQTEVLLHGGDPAALADRATALLTRMAAGVRAQGFPAGPGEAAEASRIARDLAALRGLPAPGRDELLEACTTVYAHGDVLGRGRMVARVARDVLIGAARGRLAPGTPVSGLVAAFEAERDRLRLPGRGVEERELRLEPLRTDRARELFLQRCAAARIAYAESLGIVGVGGAQAVTSGWRVRHTAATDATLAAAGLRGVTVAQAATARLNEPFGEDEPPALPVVTAHLAAAARCGLADSFDRWLAEASERLPAEADLAGLVAGLDVLTTIADGLVAGTAEPGFAELMPSVTATRAETAQAAVAQIAGLAGSDEPDDARALAELVSLITGTTDDLGVRLRAELHRLARGGAPLIAGASAAVLWRHREGADVTGVGERVADAVTTESRHALKRWLVGVFAVSPDLVSSDEEFAAALAEAVAGLPDGVFIARLPALRGGFDGLSAAERERTLTALTDLAIGGAEAAPARGHKARLRTPDIDAETLATWAAEDLAMTERLSRLGLADASFAPETRWRLILGRRHGELPDQARGLARSLDQLYGAGEGEGSGADAATGAGRDPAYPSPRHWGDALAELFGDDVRSDVVADALGAGDPRAIELLDDDSARPSTDLLATVLSMAGALPEHTLTRLRPVLRRMVDQLAAVLAARLRPALQGMTSTRRTLRDTGVLDAPATIRRNLQHTVVGGDGRFRIVAATPVFRRRMAKHAEWHVIVVVDTSGSMEPSTVHAALTAAIFAGVPVLTVTFLAFSTEVVDLSDHVDDPLALLLEISVGGGTDIARAVRVARARVRVPSRTMVVLITDFEEGGSPANLVAEVGALHDSGVTLLGCAALDDSGQARFNVAIAGQVAAAGMAVSALSPTQLARWVAEQVNP
ncbi:MAG TPA: VWA domain-containing protein, partial [Propionibacterium sp.]|nr:VWA domain-containing protein [Propionibacterium sp.]